MTIIKDFPHILHGGDYNPDQWREYPEVIDADFKLMDQSNCNTFSVNIFGWGQIEIEEGKFDFSGLDDIMNRCAAGGKKVFLATPSGARPAWLACNYPETNRVDEKGIRANWNTRHNHCWSSPVMRSKTATINRKLAERYAAHPALGGWHISNEYNGHCFCELCLENFHEFLKQRYGTLENLNRAYWSAFWSHTITDWHQVNPLDDCADATRLDWLRFTSWQVADFMRMEVAAVREHSDAPATTNMMGLYPWLDYWRIAEVCDVICDDCYPHWYNEKTEEVANLFSLMHDMHYTMLNKPFFMMESCPGIPNYVKYPKMRRPNELEREMLLAIGHGADGTMYFQWRKGRGNCEKFHGAVVGHDGTNQSRMFKEVAEYGRKLSALDSIVDTPVKPQAAVIFDWESNWALDISNCCGGKLLKKTQATIVNHYQSLTRHNAPLAVIESTCDFTPYKLLVAPMLFMLKPGVAERMRQFVANGGTLVMTYLSGYVDESNRCFFGGNPGGPEMREFFGIWSDDIDCFEPTDDRSLRYNGKEYKVEDMAEYLRPEGAETLADYTDEFFAGVPALTVKKHGKGKAYYLGARTGLDFLTAFYGDVLTGCGIEPPLPGIPDTLRVKKRGEYYFVYNMTTTEQEIKLPAPMRDLWNNREAASSAKVPPSGAIVLTK